MKKLSKEILIQAQQEQGINKTGKKNNNSILLRKQKSRKNSKAVNSIFEWIQAVAIAVVIVVILMTFVFRVVSVDGRSMMDTLQNEDRIAVYTLFYTPKAGDIVVISHAEKYDVPIVKRVIATEGQSVNVDFDTGKVYVDNKELNEPYVTHSIDYRRVDDDVRFPITVPPGKIFVMGDNRLESLDSRSNIIGMIDTNDVVGKVFAVVSPFDRIGIVD